MTRRSLFDISRFQRLKRKALHFWDPISEFLHYMRLFMYLLWSYCYSSYQRGPRVQLLPHWIDRSQEKCTIVAAFCIGSQMKGAEALSNYVFRHVTKGLFVRSAHFFLVKTSCCRLYKKCSIVATVNRSLPTEWKLLPSLRIQVPNKMSWATQLLCMCHVTKGLFVLFTLFFLVKTSCWYLFVLCSCGKSIPSWSPWIARSPKNGNCVPLCAFKCRRYTPRSKSMSCARV